MTSELIRPATRFIGSAGAFLLIFASATLGAYYGFTVGAHSHFGLGVTFAAAALGGELLKPLAVTGALDSFRAREWMRGLSCAVLASVCIIYSLASELSIAAGSRGDLAATRQAEADTSTDMRGRRTRAEAELAILPPARPADALLPLIVKLKGTPGAGNCEKPDGNAARKACGQLAELQSEAARAKRRAELESAIVLISGNATTHSAPVSDADPLASTLAAYARATGHDIEPDTITPWLALIPVLFLELGSALALVVTRSLSAAPASAAAATSPAQTLLPKCAAPTPGTNAPKPRSKLPRSRNGKPPRGTPRPGANVIELLRSHGGKLEGGQRGIAKALGVSKSRANELLNQLAAAGDVIMATSRAGTSVRVAIA